MAARYTREAAEYRRRVGDDYIIELREDNITLLDRNALRNTRFKKALFKCGPCNYHIHTEVEMEEHRVSDSHRRKVRVIEEDERMRRIQPPSNNHAAALASFLERKYREIALSENESQARGSVVRQLEMSMHQQSTILAGVKLQLTGSVRSGFALKDSDTNVRMVAPRDANFAEVFEEIKLVLENDDDSYDILMDVDSRYPSISFKTVNSPEPYRLHVTEEGKHLTNILLSAYSSNMPELHKLGVLIKYWAKISNVSDVDAGGLLPMCFPILAIFYCQQKGLIPMYEDVISEGITAEELEAEIVAINSNMCSEQRISARNLGTIWISMLEFYSMTFNKEEDCVSILSLERVCKTTKMWQHLKRIAIEEPGSPKRNLSLTVSNQRVLDFIHDKIRACYMYFAVPQPARVDPRNRTTRGVIRNGEPNQPEDFLFDFNSMKLSIEELPLFCRDCHESGHRIENCPQIEMMPCLPLDEATLQHRQTLTEQLTEIKDQNELNEEDMKSRTQILEEITRCLNGKYPDIVLQLYGSSASGFGSYSSDLDICVAFGKSTSLEGEHKDQILVYIESTLKRNRDFEEIVRIGDAKVPLVKFYHKQSKLEGDLSLYNHLAQHNTRLLLRYSQIDERVRILGFCVKEFAKGCQMADAFQKTLSSYAYILMTIFYLQRCETPVLPVLQELYEGSEKPGDRVVDDYNVWFFDGDNEELKRRWSGFGKNQKDVAQLWIGFLDFYSHEFDISTKIISIKQSADMRKLERLWNGDKLAIQDPFNDGHNLGGGLSKKTNAYILNNLIAAREVFGTSINKIPEDYKSRFSYFFENEKYSRTAPISKPNTKK